MWVPGQALSRELSQFIINSVLQDREVKAELTKQIRVEIDNQRTKTAAYNGSVQSYDSLTAGNVNMQAKMAASGYDVYGRTIMSSNVQANNNNIYKKMKNKIKYGHAPQNGYISHGSFTVA